MISVILIAFLSLIGLLVLHELSHFAAAKYFGIEVGEFGVGYPPRIFGKKIGETLYSLNLLPFGAFVKIEDKDLKEKPFWQQAIVLLAGIVSFWIIAILLLTIVFSTGSPVQVLDEDNGNLVDPRVQVVAVSSGSPAEQAGLQIGDVIEKVKNYDKSEEEVDKVGQIQLFSEKNAGKEVIMIIGRGKESFEVSLVPRESPPEGEGPLGIALARVATKKYSFFQALYQAASTSLNLTWLIIKGFFDMIKGALLREPLEVELVVPVGIFDIFVKAGNLGPVYFLAGYRI